MNRYLGTEGDCGFGLVLLPEFGVVLEFGVVVESGVEVEGFEVEEPAVPVVELLPAEEPTLPLLDWSELPEPATLMLSTTRRLPANDWAMRFASSRSFEDGAEPFSSMESSVTLTEMLVLVSVGSLRKAVWMSFLT
jgi:hypothetical protein